MKLAPTMDPQLPVFSKKYGPKVEVNWLHDDDWFTLDSLDPDLTVDDIRDGIPG